MKDKSTNNSQLSADVVCRPILFSTPMVQAILQGRKTQTRRIAEELRINEHGKIDFDFKKHSGRNVPIQHVTYPLFFPIDKIKFGKVGDILWVRETFYEPISESLNGKYYYKADLQGQGWDFKWKPSIFMPKDACRLFLEITEIRVERLKDISEEDAIKEGVENRFSPSLNQLRYKDYADARVDWWPDAVSSFQSLWASINGFNSWDENPLVWVISFKVIDRPNGFR